MRPKTQDDIVREDKGYKPAEEVRRVLIPGIEQLHTRPLNEIAEALANVLRSERGIKQITYVIGKHIELTVDSSAG